MIYSNRIAYRVDVTSEILTELGVGSSISLRSRNPRTIFAARRILSIRLARDFDLFTGVDNLAFEALTAGAIGWVAGLVTAFPKETVAIYKLVLAGRYAEALEIYRWFRPLLDLDVSTYLVQNIKLG